MADFSNPSDSVATMAMGNQGLDTGTTGGMHDMQHAGRAFPEVEGDLERGWQSARGTSGAAWQDVRHAVRDAFDRVARR